MTEECAVDLRRFRELHARTREAGDAEAARLLTEAPALWHGEPLTGVAGAWAEAAALFRKLGLHPTNDFELLADVPVSRARALLDQLVSEFPNAVHTFRHTVALVRAASNRHYEAVFLTDLGCTLADAGHPAIARSIWQTALVTLTEIGDPRTQNVRAALAAGSTRP